MVNNAKFSPPLHPAVYLRISKDAEKLGLGVDRQRGECADLLDGRGWPDPLELVDNDISAFSGKERPDYLQLLEHLESGHVDAVVVYSISRLTRTPRDLEDLIDLCKIRFFRLLTTEGDLDLTTPQGKSTARNLVGQAANYSDTNQRSLRLKHKTLAAEGKHAGKVRVYGYDEVFTDHPTDPTKKVRHRVINPEEAEVIEKLIEQVIREDTAFLLAGACRMLNGQGKLTVAGRQWSVQSLRKMLTSWRICGVREHRVGGELVLSKAQWKAIVTREDFETSLAILTNPSRVTVKGARVRKHWLSNLIFCGVEGCGQPMQAGVSKGIPTYKCNRSSAAKPHYLGITKSVVDQVVLVHLVARLGAPEPELQAFLDDEPEGVRAIRSELAEVRADITDLQQSGLKMATIIPSLRGLEAREEALTGSLSAFLRRDALRGPLTDLQPFSELSFSVGLERATAIMDSMEDLLEEDPETGVPRDLATARTIVSGLLRIRIEPFTRGKTSREDAIARVRVTDLDPATGETVSEEFVGLG